MNVQSLLMCGLLYVGSYSLVMALAYTFEFRLAPAIVAVLIPLAALFADYKAWSKGLRAAGYATDPGYSTKLIRLIERWDLHLLDQVK